MLSVLIPVYNTRPEYIIECMDSVYNQSIDKTMEHVEVVVVDNDSTDEGTINELKRQESIRKNFRLFHVPRQEGKRNLSIALNYGISQCKYELIARMDSDDIMRETRLAKQVRYLYKHKDVDICGTHINVLSDNPFYPILLPAPTINDILVINPILHHPTVMFRKSRIMAIGGYQETDPRMPEDLELWIRCAKNNYVIRNLEEILLDYRMHGTQSSGLDREAYYNVIARQMIDAA